MAVTAEAISAANTRDIVMVGAFPVWLEKLQSAKGLALRIVGTRGKFPFKGDH
jgi:hypothetical protein